MHPVGILGLGKHLPEAIRTNDWWPPDVVASWKRPIGLPPTHPTMSDAERELIEAMQAQEDDPFGGAVKRHVLPENGSILEMQAKAAEIALARAEVNAGEIDLLLTCVTPTDYQLTNAACELHERLGLPRECFSLHVDGTQHAFLLQLSIAESMIATGRAHRALLIQASAMSRLLDPKSPMSPHFGDGATAAIVGPVSNNRGLLSVTHRTDGSLPNALVASVIGKRWYEEGRVQLHLRDPDGMRHIFLQTVELSKEGIETALSRAGLEASDVDVIALHQGTPWLAELVQRHTGLTHARTVATIQDTAHLFAASLPSTLIAAQEAGLVSDGNLVVLGGGGNGMTYGAAVLRWGR